MKHVDVFLLEVIKDNFYLPNIEWDHKDKKILESLGHQLKSGVFLTENQGNLLVKLLLQYKTDLEKFTTLRLEFLNSPEWSKSFRLITVSRNIFLNPAELTEIYMEFSYNKKIKEKLFDQQKKIQGTITHHKNNVYSVSLTEKNVCTLVEAFKDQGFKIDQKLISFYEEIQNIKNSSEINFNITRSINTHLIEKLKEDIGHDHTNCPILLHDRKLRFQYEYSEFLEENCECRKPKPGMLKEIAHRFSINLKNVPAIGDSLRDLQAFDAAGAQPILVKTGKGEETLAKGGLPKNTWVCENLAEAAQKIITEYA